MASGNYSTIRPATVLAADVDIYYNYTPNRQTLPSDLTTLDATSVLLPVFIPNDQKEVLGGAYTLKLPIANFNKIGIYTIFIRPKVQKATIIDCGVLSALPEQKGLVLSINDFTATANKISPSGLMGHRIEYLEDDGSVRPNYFTIITSSNRCEAVTQNIGNTTQKSVTYRFNETANLIYLTVTPSTAPSVKANVLPFIGVAGQSVLISNPYVDPTSLQIELTEYDLESIAIGLFGEQTLVDDDGVLTWYKTVNGVREIYKQATLGKIKDEFNNPLIDFKEAMPQIDTTKSWDNLLGNIQNI